MEEEQKKKHASKTIWRVICGKIDFEDDIHSKAIAMLISLIFNLVALLLAITSIVVLVATIYFAATVSWTSEFFEKNLMVCVVASLVVLLCLVVAFILRLTALGIEKEKDRNYVIALFSGLTGFIALIISLIALFK